MYLRWGGGFGYGALGGSGPTGDASLSGGAFSVLVAIGGTPGRGLAVAGAIGGTGFSGENRGGSLQSESNASASQALFGALVDWYPDPREGWHVGGMAALGVESVSSDYIPQSSGGNYGVTVIGGYDWWIGPQWSVGLLALASVSTSATLRDKYDDETGYELGGYSLGIGYAFTIH